jgi:hypothetical protein
MLNGSVKIGGGPYNCKFPTITKARCGGGNFSGVWVVRRRRGQLRVGRSRVDRYLRGLFVAGALAVTRYPRSMALNIGHSSRLCWHRGRQRSAQSCSPDNRRDVKVGRANST